MVWLPASFSAGNFGCNTYYDICLSESLLDASISNEDERIRIEGYNLLQADHPRNKKREVFVYTI